ncbi:MULTISPECIES: hypothetical protein [Prochlorococcus]|uniref:Glycosyltransferase RgtA/B/C/D-like domain-containing protein n=1 Tax=Prochlorococcus marinus str. MIT 9116 TaxID=167544 RepID=A0A0A1ZY75_PROMR|nr:hypothetical protein [Prochlorococcus marinus]KGF91716.1 hypothetical protein EU92_0461 [Prochlorococcus marinus str. MIT 9107]KGF93098.1 hypothetical protein EU93_0273 [Prochlorococcus marinus str. MIT 9116]KGF95081.1 hypothetical protein EU94_0379 [Prochlorococcus marinus str. MIT 9123]
MKKRPINKRFISESIRYPLYFFLIILFIFFTYTLFHPIPTPISAKTIGLGADYLAIGDRNFYFQENSSLYGYGDNGSIKGSFLYPYILNFLAFITSKLGSSTILWNTLVIFLATICALGSLFFIDRSANIIFDKGTAKIASWIFVLCPYTIYYCLSGGITIYMTFGVAFSTYLISKSNLFNPSKFAHKIPLTISLLLLNVLFLSSIRPTGSIFSIVVIFLLGAIILSKSLRKLISLSRVEKIIIYSVFSFCLAYCFYQLKVNTNYLTFTFNNFVSEGGTFFGIERQLLRDKITSFANEDLNYIKSYFYLILWKVIDFVAGLSDIRDSHSLYGFNALFPSISRIFVGIFIIYPINLLAFFGIFIYFKKIFYYGLWINLFAAILCLGPNLLGVAFTRYLIMIYPPLIIISAKTFGLILNELKNQKNLKIS